MATKKSGYSAGAKKLLMKADKYMAKRGDSKGPSLSRLTQAEKAGIKSKMGDSSMSEFSTKAYGSSEYRTLEREISKVKKETKSTKRKSK